MSEVTEATASGTADALASRLLETLDDVAFFDKVFERRSLHLKRLFSVDEVAAIFPMDDFDARLMSGSIMSPHLDIVKSGARTMAAFRSSPSPGTDTSQLLQELKQGSTVRLAHTEHYMPSLAAFCRTLEARFHTPIRANMYLTPPFSQGFAPHYDLDDIVVLQVFGQKRWLYHERYSNQADLPNAELAFDAARHRPMGPPRDFLLEQGDILYLPRGFMHEARTDEHVSMHITLALVGVNMAQFIQHLVKHLAVGDVALRRIVAFDPADQCAAKRLSDIGREIQDLAERMTAPDTLSQFANLMHDGLAQHRNPDHTGALLRGLREGFDAAV